MNIDCGIIKDLLPLYAENLCSPQSARAVEAHVKDCADCARELDALRAPQPDLQPLAALPLKKLSHKLRRSGWRLTGFIVALVLMFTTVGLYHFTARHYVRYEQGLVSVDVEPDGHLRVGTARPAQMEVHMYPTPGSNEVLVYVTLFNVERDGQGVYRLYDLPTPDAQVNAYYAYPNEQAVLLMGKQDPEGDFFTLPRLALNSYVALMVGALIVWAALSLLLRKWPYFRRYAGWLWTVPTAYLQAHLMIKGANGTSWNMGRDFAFIAVAAVFGAIALLLVPHTARSALTDDRTLKS